MLVIADLIVFLLSYVAAALTRFGYPVPAENLRAMYVVVPWTALVFLSSMYYLDAYSRYARSFEDLGWAAFISALFSALAAIVLSFWLRAFAFPRTVILLAFLYQLLFFLILTYAKVTIAPEKPFSAITALGVSEETAKLVAEEVVPLESSEAVIVKGEDLVGLLGRVIEHKKPLIIDPPLEQIMLLNGVTVTFDDHPFIFIHSWAFDAVQVVAKRIIDILAGLVGSLMTVFLLPFVALAIYLDSPGPVFYTQLRLGRGGKPFRLVKFRTMIPDAERFTGPVLAGDDDPRITRVGRFLRKTRLDELPQFFNILIGEMSLVGPRPERPELYEQIRRDVPEFYARLLVKPGLTGYAQVYASYSVDFRYKLFYDLLYITKPSVLSADLKVILLTVRTVFKRAGK
ncbi:sugar transferase [Coprothermobacteraceae bacterium]|nr:sugar transferase [Coprothermobacteraceae bacterium]